MKKILYCNSNKTFVLLYGLVLLNFLSLQAQITNVEADRVKTDTIGWYGEANLGLEFQKEKHKTIEFTSGARAQYKNHKNLYLLLGEYERSRASGKTFKNKAYLHARYNRRINSWIKWELYSQIQFNKNTNIDLRLVNGTGPRFRLFKTEKARMYSGISYMYEYSRELDEDKKHIILREHRNSSYLSFSLFPTDAFSIISTTYYQPRWDKWKDYRISNATELRFKIYKTLVFGVEYKLNYDTYPAFGVPKITHSLKNKIGITF